MQTSKKTYYKTSNNNNNNKKYTNNNNNNNSHNNKNYKNNKNVNNEEDDSIKEIYTSITMPNIINNNNTEILPTPSDEQNEIMLQFKNGHNLKVEAVAGAGKTTTLLFLARIASNNFNVKSLILTYNKSLQVEIEKTIQNCGLSGSCLVYTYHGYASRIYRKVINNDKILRQALQNDPPQNPQNFVVLLDEVQDMNEDYHKLVSKIIFQGQLLVLVGDRRQCINEYIGADIKYLVNYDQYFNTGRPWKELTLRTSYRMTPALANFVNKNIINEELIIGGNNKYNDIKPLYYYSEWNFSKDNILSNMVKIFGPDEVVILKASVSNVSLKKQNDGGSEGRLCPLGRLVNNSKDIKFCVREEGALSEKEMQGKVLLSSFNSFKGKEKCCVVVYGFDESYFKFFDKTWPADKKSLPNILYVASTRAKCCLIIVQDEKNDHFRTTTKSVISSTCNVIGCKNENVKDEKEKRQKQNHSIVDVIKHRTTTDIIKMLDLIKIKEIKSDKEDVLLSYNHLIEFGSYYEDMRTYYGILIPVIAEFRMKGDVRFNETIPIPDENNGMTEPPHIVKRYNELILNKNKTMCEWCELIILHNSLNSGYYFYVEQITNYHWVDDAFVNASVDRLLKTISDDGSFEVSTAIKKFNIDKTKYNKYNLSGTIDYLTKNEIWEFKNVTTLNDEHKLQCAAYTAVHFLDKGIMLPGKLYNTRSNELLEITVNDPIAFIEILMSGKG
jgi:hypothetical protein